MKKSIRKTLFVLPVLVLCLVFSMPTTALAASNTQDGITAQLTLCTEKYYAK